MFPGFAGCEFLTNAMNEEAAVVAPLGSLERDKPEKPPALRADSQTIVVYLKHNSLKHPNQA